jgi:hypothetical protein
MSDDVPYFDYHRVARELRVFKWIVTVLIALPIIDMIAYFGGLHSVWPWFVPTPPVALIISVTAIVALSMYWTRIRTRRLLSVPENVSRRH